MPADEEQQRAPVLGEGVRQTILVTGICSVVLGVMLGVWPQKTVGIAELLCGLYLLLSGMTQLTVAFAARFAWPLRLELFLSGALAVAMAVLTLLDVNSVLLLDVWLGLAWITRGIAHATAAAWTDDLPHAGKQELFGLFTIALGIVVILLEVNSLVALGVVAGLGMIAIGALELLAVTAVRADGIHLPGPALLRWRTAQR
ncbi:MULTISPECIES: DUF308 domain-containing protein [unclassified Nocardia]|uniref:DUF308 domain-containing protein n=1 Tax=unclassified Nocardia TaxID=2637762 RepID=UPI001CE4A257|nr:MULTISPECIES: DUF308 domain-containing protein [unclassified Nocardia]